MDQKPLLGHPSCCHGLFGLHVHHISENHSQHLLNLVSDLNIRKIEVVQSTVTVTWFHCLKNKAKHAHKGLWAELVYFVTSCGLKVSTVVYVALLTDWFGVLVFP